MKARELWIFLHLDRGAHGVTRPTSRGVVGALAASETTTFLNA